MSFVAGVGLKLVKPTVLDPIIVEFVGGEHTTATRPRDLVQHQRDALPHHPAAQRSHGHRHPVPDEIVEGLGAGRKPPVRVTIGGHTYRSTVASRGGRYLVGVSAENRQAACCEGRAR